MKKIVCFYAGGIKSIALLLQILLDKKYIDYLIQVHSIEIINHTMQFRQELITIERTLQFFQQYSEREFLTTQNQVNFSCLPLGSPLPSNFEICLFVASQMINVDPSIEYIAFGNSLEDIEKFKPYGNLREKAEAYLEMAKLNPEGALNAKHLFPFLSVSRAQVIEQLINQEAWQEIKQYIQI